METHMKKKMIQGNTSRAAKGRRRNFDKFWSYLCDKEAFDFTFV